MANHRERPVSRDAALRVNCLTPNRNVYQTDRHSAVAVRRSPNLCTRAAYRVALFLLTYALLSPDASISLVGAWSRRPATAAG